jgi:uncharacterized protein (TIGR03435 family)
MRIRFLSTPALLAFVCSAACAQSFEVASIHASEPGLRTGNIHTDPGVFTIHNMTLHFCIEWAYGVRPLQITGPAWLGEVRFDINAKAADHNADDDQLRLMVRAMLADRFGLQVHHEQKEQQIFALSVAKNGPKFHPKGTKDASRFTESATDGATGFSEDKTGAMADHVTMGDAANKVSELVNRIVIDKTGLTGRYDFRLDLTPYMTPDTDGKDGAKADIMSILFAGFNDQLGLKLEAGKEFVDLLVVDAVNKTPTEN